MQIKEYLNQAYKLNRLIECKQKQLDNLKSLSTTLGGCQNNDRVQTSIKPDKISSIIAKIVDLNEEINEDIDRYVDLKREIMQNIDRLEDGDQIQLLYKRYLEMKPWEYIAVEMDYSIRQIYRIHGEALKKMALNVTMNV